MLFVPRINYMYSSRLAREILTRIPRALARVSEESTGLFLPPPPPPRLRQQSSRSQPRSRSATLSLDKVDLSRLAVSPSRCTVNTRRDNACRHRGKPADSDSGMMKQVTSLSVVNTCCRCGHASSGRAPARRVNISYLCK